MRRKLIAQGLGGYTISLPKKWVEERGLKPKDEVEIEESESGLLIRGEGKQKKKTIEIKLTTETESTIRIILNNIYKLGYDQAIVRFGSNRQLQHIKNVVETRLLGFSITEKQENKITIENLTEPREEKQKVLLRRVFLIIKETMETIGDDLEEGKFPNIRKIQGSTNNLGEYIYFLKRSIIKKKTTEERIEFKWGLYTYLLLMQHSMLHLYEITNGKKQKINPKVKQKFQALKENYNKIYEGYYKKDMKTIQKANEESKKNLYDGVIKEIGKTKQLDTQILYYIGELSRLIYLSASPIMGLILE